MKKKKRIIWKYNWIKLFTAKNTSITCPYNVRISLCHFKSNAICKRSFWPPHPCSLISPCTALFALNLKAGVPAVSSLTLPYSKRERKGGSSGLDQKGRQPPPSPIRLFYWTELRPFFYISLLFSVLFLSLPVLHLEGANCAFRGWGRGESSSFLCMEREGLGEWQKGAWKTRMIGVGLVEAKQGCVKLSKTACLVQ